MRMLVICGHKGVGKTYLGHALANILRWKFVDTDKEIESEYQSKNSLKLSCREIYSKHGEAFFRLLEQKVISQISSRTEVIISIGGGSLLSEINYNYLKQFPLLILKKEKEILKHEARKNPSAYLSTEAFDLSFETSYRLREEVFQKLNAPCFKIDSPFNFSNFMDFIHHHYGF